MPFNPHWGSTKKRATHKYEYLIEAILNKQFYKYDLRAKRVKDDPFSPYDLGIYLFDYDRLTYGEEICKLDLERKTDEFPMKDKPKRWTRGYSFLERKITIFLKSETISNISCTLITSRSLTGASN